MQEWQTKHGLADGPSQPQPHYDTMKKAIMHAVICFSKSDHPIRIMKVRKSIFLVDFHSATVNNNYMRWTDVFIA
jgi:hypothetical protein